MIFQRDFSEKNNQEKHEKYSGQVDHFMVRNLPQIVGSAVRTKKGL